MTDKMQYVTQGRHSGKPRVPNRTHTPSPRSWAVPLALPAGVRVVCTDVLRSHVLLQLVCNSSVTEQVTEVDREI
jgi:hypothetical protein